MPSEACDTGDASSSIIPIKKVNNSPQIEVTPEMLEAASEFLEQHYLGDGVYDLSDGVMTGLYRAMHALSRTRFQPPSY